MSERQENKQSTFFPRFQKNNKKCMHALTAAFKGKKNLKHEMKHEDYCIQVVNSVIDNIILLR